MTTPFPFVSGAVLTAQQLNDITNLPINDQTASYTLVVGDAGKRVVMNVATANTLTINNSVFTTGDTIQIINKGAGTTTVTAGAGVTVNTAGNRQLLQQQSATIVMLSASTALMLPTLKINRTKVISSTRDLSAATGTVAYTGAGFTPSNVFQLSGINFSIMSRGFADKDRTGRCITNPSGSGSQSYVYPSFIYLETGAGAQQNGSISSYDSDGFTISWTKGGAPTGVATLEFLCVE